MTVSARRVVVTGVGPITAIGIGKDAFWAGLKRQQSGINAITRFDPSPFNSHIAGEILDFDATQHMDPHRARRLDRFSQFAIAASRLAVDDARLPLDDLNPARSAVQVGSALGGIANAEMQCVNFVTKGLRAVEPRVALTTFAGAASCNIAIEFGFTGPNATNAMSCASGAMAIGDAARLIREGEADVALAGGVEAPLSPLSFGAFAIIRAMSTRNDDPKRACRPFDRDRDGFVMGEGACILVLEEEQHALARGAHVYASVDGYGTTSDAYHMTAPLADGSQAARAMQLALDQASTTSDSVDYINAHASATSLNDSSETTAIHTVFGQRATQIPVSGTKPYHAHSLGASGAIEAAVCCLAMERSWVPPTLNLEHPDVGCDLDYVIGSGRDLAINRIMSNSFGFGGINASLIFGAPQ